jgi:hypothetical protein
MAALFIRSVAVFIGCGILVNPAVAELLTSDDSRFSIEISGVPQVRYQWSDASKGSSWSVQFNATPPLVVSSNRDQRYDAAVKAVVDALKGTMKSQKAVAATGVPGREIIIEFVRGNLAFTMREQMFITDNRFYQVSHTGPTGKQTEAELDAVFNSFQIR